MPDFLAQRVRRQPQAVRSLGASSPPDSNTPPFSPHYSCYCFAETFASLRLLNRCIISCFLVAFRGLVRMYKHVATSPATLTVTSQPVAVNRARWC